MGQLEYGIPSPNKGLWERFPNSDFIAQRIVQERFSYAMASVNLVRRSFNEGGFPNRYRDWEVPPT